MATRRPRGLRPLLLNTEATSSSNQEDPRPNSVDLNPAQRELLDLSSPYHDSFPTPSTPYDEQGNHIRRPSNPFASLLRSFSYTGVGFNFGFPSRSRPDAEKAHSHEGQDDNDDNDPILRPQSPTTPNMSTGPPTLPTASPPTTTPAGQPSPSSYSSSPSF
jgi:hypothetical protein